MISYVLIILASICNAVMDTCSFHYSTSIFTKFNPKWWDASVSWKNKYIDGDPTKGMRKWFFGLLDYPVFLTDAWHWFKSSMIVFIVLAIVLYKPLFGEIIDFMAIGLVWNMAFNFCYNVIFKKK